MQRHWSVILYKAAVSSNNTRSGGKAELYTAYLDMQLSQYKHELPAEKITIPQYSTCVSPVMTPKKRRILTSKYVPL